jgi:hypothetical protein
VVDFDIAIPDLNGIEVARLLTLAGPSRYGPQASPVVDS